MARHRAATARLAPLVLSLAVQAGCSMAAAPAAAPDPLTGTAGVMMVPPGQGTLRQDDASVSLRTTGVLLKITPLDEGVIRLLAPDTYQRLHALRESRAVTVASRSIRDLDLVLVSFFGIEADAAFQPEAVTLLHQARLMRPAAIMPLTAGWGRQQLNRQETQAAVYAFAGPVDYGQAIILRYGSAESHGWQQVILRLEAERARVLTRIR